MKNTSAIFVILFAAISGCACADTKSSFVLPSGAKVEVVESDFDGNRFKVSGCKGMGDPCRINDHIPYGSDFTVPQTYVKSIVVSDKGERYILDVSDMYDAWGSRPLQGKGNVRYFGGNCFDPKNCQFRGMFSDAAGAFVAEWKIVDGISMRTVLTSSADIIGLFARNIDPPVFE